MLVSLFAIMSMAVSADIVEYSTSDGFKYKLDTETKTAEVWGDLAFRDVLLSRPSIFHLP